MFKKIAWWISVSKRSGVEVVPQREIKAKFEWNKMYTAVQSSMFDRVEVRRWANQAVDEILFETEIRTEFVACG